MKIGLNFILLAALVQVPASNILAQDTTAAARTAEHLRAQLSDVLVKEAALQSRAQQLDEALKPENIERYFQLTGSTRPEELREQRRLELSNKKTTMLAQLEQLAASRARLESAIITADALAYQQSAQGTTDAQSSETMGAQYLTSSHLNTPRLLGWLGGMLMAIIAIMVTAALIAVIRKPLLP
jgi:hypothetical protein